MLLTDGADTGSQIQPHAMCRDLQRANVVVDCVIINPEDDFSDSLLKAVSHATGGCCFKPDGLTDALKLFETETVLSLAEREAKRATPVASFSDLRRVQAQLRRRPFDAPPQRRLPALLSRPVAHGEEVLDRARRERQTEASKGGGGAGDVQLMRRVLRELKGYMRNPHPNIEVFPCEDNALFWRILLQGPESSPYAGGTFLLYCSFPAGYPSSPPEVRFVTEIFHANINSTGKVCHAVFKRDWSSDLSTRRVLDCVYGLLLAPEPDDPLDSTRAELFFADRPAYDEQARRATRARAAKSVAAWRKEMGIWNPEERRAEDRRLSLLRERDARERAAAEEHEGRRAVACVVERFFAARRAVLAQETARRSAEAEQEAFARQALHRWASDVGPEILRREAKAERKRKKIPSCMRPPRPHGPEHVRRKKKGDCAIM